jgi:DNA-directed RNA polymerase subunit alpha
MANTIDLRGLVRPQLVESTKRDDNPNVAEFRLQPLERGFGHTLGNSMRRMLLSSLRGSAVWAFRIDGVVHEHQTIPGVVEDVHQIIANLKSLTLILAEDVEEVVLHHAHRVRPVTRRHQRTAELASSIPRTTCSRPDDRDLNVDLYVNKGRGYIESRPVPSTAVSCRPGSHRLIYNPVRRANFTVAETRRPAHGLRSSRAHGRDQRHDLAGRSGHYAAALAQTHFRFADFGALARPDRLRRRLARRRRAARWLAPHGHR